MTAGSVIAGRVAEMQAAMASEPSNGVMGAFSREQAEARRCGRAVPAVAILYAGHLLRWIDVHPD